MGYKKTQNGNHSGKTAIAYAGVSVEEDGFWVSVGNGKRNFCDEFVRTSAEERDKRIYAWLFGYSADNPVKIVGAGIVGGGNVDDLTADLWLKQDIVPFVFDIKGKNGRKKSVSATLEVAKAFGYDDIIDIKYDARRRVRTVKLSRLEDYRKTCRNGSYDVLVGLAEKFKKQEGKIVFFSSTPRGGGVALMRHALIRLYRLLGIDADWYVMSSKSAVFEITKKKFHNILQGVAPPEVCLNGGDMEALRVWTEKNARRFNGVFKKSSVIVIDDPQPSGMIPYIKKVNPEAKIIYRSHIQIRADLLEKEGSPQKKTWDYLWKSIKYADVFVSHPVKSFVPKSVPARKTVLMAAATDNLDGLNKKLSKRQIGYYMDIFNRELEKSSQSPLDQKRPYIAQIARFDPSKGIPDVIESFRKLRKMLGEKRGGKSKHLLPQLVIAGHGSVDDPEATMVYGEVVNILKSDAFKDLAEDIKVVRLPDHDQLLNALLRSCKIALQLSHREGFEVKVSEALEKGRPVIAYRAGGIPLQIENGVTGYLVKIGDTEQVAKRMFELLVDRKKYEKMSKAAREKVNFDYFTVGNASNWLCLANALMEEGEGVFLGGGLRVETLREKAVARN